MIRRLQQKFVVIAMSSLLLVLIVVLGLINGFYVYQMVNKSNGALKLLGEYDGNFPNDTKLKELMENSLFNYQMTEETPYETRYFTAKVAPDGTIITVCVEKIAAVSTDEVKQYAKEVFSSGKLSGYKGVYKYLVVDKGAFSLIIFLDCNLQLQTMRFFLLISISIALFTLIVMFILVYALSKRAIQPVIENVERQKQFITNAGHELKTPLAIISANADVLEVEHGKSEWIQSIHGQINRMNELIKKLLTLSKMNETDAELTLADFSISDVVWETVSSFEPLAEKQQKYFETAIQSNLNIYGDENLIRQLASILIDNAVKYSESGHEIKISLRQQGKNLALELSNYSDTLPDGNLNKLLERFVRADDSRSRDSGGYGIGLSIAAAIVQAHKGKISVRRERDKWIYFSIFLPRIYSTN